jgi:hypothetical protein
MISSLLTMANNALIYNGRSITPSLRQHDTYVNEVNRQEENVYLADSVEEKKETPEVLSSKNKFTASLEARYKETGLTGSDSAERIVQLADAAQKAVQAVDDEEGSLASNQLKALILTTASGTDPEGTLTKAVQSFVAAKSLELAAESREKKAEEEKKANSSPTVTKEEVAKKAEEKIEKEASKESEKVANDKGSKNDDSEPVDIVATIKTALESIEDLSLGTEKANLGIANILPIINKVKADLPKTAESVTQSGLTATLDQTKALQNQSYYQGTLNGFGAYASKYPTPGSLVSHRI